MSTSLTIATVVLTFLAMELVAWATHKYIMHGFLWKLHSDHHRKDHYHALERNDLFFLIFAIPSIILFYAGHKAGPQQPWTWIGLGILFYGMAYFIIHEIFIHQRIKLFRNTRNRYLLAIRRAHKIHHKHLTKHNGEYFGMLWAPLSFLKATGNRGSEKVQPLNL